MALEVALWYNAVCAVLLSYIVQPPKMLAYIYIVPLCARTCRTTCNVPLCGRAMSDFAVVQCPTLRPCNVPLCSRTTLRHFTSFIFRPLGITLYRTDWRVEWTVVYYVVVILKQTVRHVANQFTVHSLPSLFQNPVLLAFLKLLET